MSHEGISPTPTKSEEVSRGTASGVEGDAQAYPRAVEERAKEIATAPDPAIAERAAIDTLALAATRERLGLVTQEADPTTYSQLPPTSPLEQVGVANGGNKIVTTGGERYININQHPERQEAVARMLKGILNVSDIVRVVDGENPPAFYSKEVPIDLVQQETSLEETQADFFILKQVFGDFDHKFSDEKVNNIERQNDRSIYYDFGNANPMNGDNARYSFKLLDEDIGTLSTEEKSIVVQKLDALQERFSGVSGEHFIDSIIKASGMEPTALFGLYDFQIPDILEKTGSGTLDSAAVQKRILNRIDTVRNSIANSVPPLLPSEEAVDDELPPPLPEDDELPPPLP